MLLVHGCDGIGEVLSDEPSLRWLVWLFASCRAVLLLTRRRRARDRTHSVVVRFELRLPEW